jgi:tetratricopeptide (TPR) repeat protein
MHLRTNNPSGAMQMAEIWRQHPFVHMLSALLWEDEDAPRALDCARHAVEQAPFHPVYQAVLARMAEKNQDYAQALEAIEVALGIWENEILWQIKAADLAERCGEMASCRHHLEKALQLNPSDYDLLVRLVQHYLMTGYSDQAVKLLQSVIHLYGERSEIWLLMALAFQGCNNDKAALQAAEKAVELDGTNGKAWITAGEIALRLGDENKVLYFARQAERVAPADAGTRSLVVKILIRQGELREALTELSRAIEEIPGQWELEFERARLIGELQGVAAAQELLQRLVVNYPQNEQILWLFAQTCMKTGKVKLAEQSGLQALKLNPQNVEIHRLLAEVFKDQGQLDRAVFHLSEAIRLQPAQLETYLKLGEVYTTRREFHKALGVYQQAIQVNPQDYRPYYYSALVFRDGKDYPAAEVMLRRAAELAPEDVNIRRQLGAIIALNLVHHGQEAKTCL